MKKVEEMGVEMPKYYRAGAINPVSYAEQVQKRKMLWKKPGTGGEEAAAAPEKAAAAPEKAAAPSQPACQISFNKWEATNFGTEEANEKFRRLMGIKAAPKPEELQVEDAPGASSAKIMSDLDKEYEVARKQTHRNRGLGLGFSSLETGYQHHHHQPQGYGAPGYGAPAYGAQAPAPGPAGAGFRGRGGFGINFVKKQ